MRKLFLILICCFAFVTYGFSQSISVSGLILSANDSTLLDGVSIKIKGTNKGVVSNPSGLYSITCSPNATLVFTSIGYTQQEVQVNKQTVINIKLQPGDNSQLTDVVVTALGIRKEKAKISYATQEVKGTSLEKAPQPNVAENLIGKVAGLNIIPKTNLFENPEILLRGEKTLVVIDGVPTDNNNFDFWSLNPNDIDNVNVLKGTAAAALYGSLGINGAIMITTKKGKSGGKGVEFTYNSTTQFQTGFLKVPKTQDQYGMGWSGTYAFIDGKGGKGWYDDYGYVWGPKLNTGLEYPQYNSEYDADNTFPFSQNGYDDESHYKSQPAITRGKDNLKNFLNNELITTQNFAIAGKSDNGDYRISLTHMYQKGQVPNTKLNSTTLSVSGNLKITDKFKIESSLSYNKQYSPNFPQTGYSASNYFL